MPEWARAALAVATTLAAWRWAVKPTVRFARDLVDLLRQIRASATGVAGLTAEVRALAGSIVTLAAAIMSDQQNLRDEHAWLREQHQELASMVIDLDAGLRRIEKKVDAHHSAPSHRR